MPAAEVELLYETQETERSFAADLVLHLMHGYVFSTPNIFLMGKCVPRTAPIEEIRNPARSWPSMECDMWFIYAAAGDLEMFFRYMPFPLEYCGWERYYGLRIYKTARLIDRITESCTTPFLFSRTPGSMPVGD